MKSTVTCFLALLFLFFSFGCVDDGISSEPAPSGPQQSREESDWEIQQQNAALGKGINLGNALDAPNEGDWFVTLHEQYFSKAAELGFQSIRLPIRWSNHVGSAPDYSIDQQFLDRVDWAIDQAFSNDLRIVINIHHFEELMVYPDSLKPVFLAVWKQLSEHYKNYGPELYFELLNEPNENLTVDLWNEYLQEALEIVRETNPKRSVIIGPADWGTISALSQLHIPDDEYVILSVHYYNPTQFVYQGAHWIEGSDVWLGTKWNAAARDTSRILDDLQQIEDFAQQSQLPVYIGEYGTYDSADVVSRVLYTSYVTKEFLRRGWSFAYWKYNTDMGIYDDENDTIRTHLADAIIYPHKSFDDYLPLVEQDDPVHASDSFVLLDDFEDTQGDKPDQIYMAGLYSQQQDIPIDSVWGFFNVYHNDSSAIYNGSGTRIFNYLEIEAGSEPNLATAVGPWGKTGSGLHLKCALKGESYPYVGFGTSFLGRFNEDWLDFSSLEAVSFWAKGFGEMRVSFDTDTILNGYSAEENWGHFSHDFSLSSEWRHYVLLLEDFEPKMWSEAQKDGLTWEDGMERVCYIEWQSIDYGMVADDSLEIYIDDIKLHGLDYETFGVTAPE